MSIVPKALAERIKKCVEADPAGRTHLWTVVVAKDLHAQFMAVHARETPELDDVYLGLDDDLKPGEWYLETQGFNRHTMRLET